MDAQIDEIEVITGERREMVDRLLGKASELYGPTARCIFRSCYGQTEEVVQFAGWGEGGALTWDLQMCEDHFDILRAIMERSQSDAEVAGFLSLHLDEARSGFREALDKVRNADGNG